jgi:hypothetical protein
MKQRLAVREGAIERCVVRKISDDEVQGKVL